MLTLLKVNETIFSTSVILPVVWKTYQTMAPKLRCTQISELCVLLRPYCSQEYRHSSDSWLPSCDVGYLRNEVYSTWAVTEGHSGQERQTTNQIVQHKMSLLLVFQSVQLLESVSCSLATSRLNLTFCQDLLRLPGMSQPVTDKIFQQCFCGKQKHHRQTEYQGPLQLDTESFRAVVAKLGSWGPQGSLRCPEGSLRQLPRKQPCTLRRRMS